MLLLPKSALFITTEMVGPEVVSDLYDYNALGCPTSDSVPIEVKGEIPKTSNRIVGAARDLLAELGITPCVWGELGLDPPPKENARREGDRAGVRVDRFGEPIEGQDIKAISFVQAPHDPVDAFESFASLRQWVAWDVIEGAKTPISPKTGRYAKSSDRTTWGTRARAEARAESMCKPGKVGIMLGPIVDNESLSLGGVDMDGCRDPDTGELTGWATATIKGLGATYAEVSPSGRGVKAFFTYATGEVAALRNRLKVSSDSKGYRKILATAGDHKELAVDLQGRFYIVTGDRLDATPGGLATIGPDEIGFLVDVAAPMARKAFGKKGDDGKRDRSKEAYRLAIDFKRDDDREGWEAALAADPDLAEWASDARQVERAWAKAPTIDVDALLGGGAFDLTEDGVALAFTDRFRDELRFCHDSGRWYQWRGSHWARETTALAFDWVRATCREMAATEPDTPAAKMLAKATTASAVEKFARADRAHAVTSDGWDRNPWLLGTPGGTVDLRTGAIRDARPDDMITRLTAAAPLPLESFDPERDCPRWLAFLDDATGGDVDSIRFLQQWAGYSLTGDTREEALLFVHGPGGSGKSTWINTIADALGDYAVNVDPATITAGKFDRHSTELARLKGARLARASETEAGRSWAEARIKALTGGDVITARFMRCDDFEFRPEFKLTIVGNHRPAIQNVDEAMRRRFNVMPFDHPPKTVDDGLKDALRLEFPAILSWALRGCLDWQANGLARPRIVIETTASYFDSQDTFAQWIEEDCETGPACAATTADLWASWSMFARIAGEDPGSKVKAFPDRLRGRGFEPIQSQHGIRGRGWRGLTVRDAFDDLGGDQ